MITPVNNHLLIEPVPHEEFVSSQQETYQEIGVVVAVSGEMHVKVPSSSGSYEWALNIKPGDKVYFDSWLAAKFPKDKDGHYWLVKWEDVRAVEYAEQQVSE